MADTVIIQTADLPSTTAEQISTSQVTNIQQLLCSSATVEFLTLCHNGKVYISSIKKRKYLNGFYVILVEKQFVDMYQMERYAKGNHCF